MSFRRTLALLRATREPLDGVGEYRATTFGAECISNASENPVEWRRPMTRILFVGQKPETVDFSDPSLPPGFDASSINAGIAVAVAKI